MIDKWMCMSRNYPSILLSIPCHSPVIPRLLHLRRSFLSYLPHYFGAFVVLFCWLIPGSTRPNEQETTRTKSKIRNQRCIHPHPHTSLLGCFSSTWSKVRPCVVLSHPHVLLPSPPFPCFASWQSHADRHDTKHAWMVMNGVRNGGGR